MEWVFHFHEIGDCCCPLESLIEAEGVPDDWMPEVGGCLIFVDLHWED